MPMLDALFDTASSNAAKAARRITLVSPADLKEQSAAIQDWAESCGFKGAPASVLFLGEGLNDQSDVLVGIGNRAVGVWSLGGAADKLPVGRYTLTNPLDHEAFQLVATGFAFAQYRFDRYKTGAPLPAAKTLILPPNMDIDRIKADVEANALVRDLINTPAEDMGPAELEKTAETLAAEFEADLKVIRGDDLLEASFPAIHAVGRAASADRAPRLIDLNWSGASKDAPSITLVGKGVVFDSGGLNIKPASGMRLMKKDMGGAAHVLGLALYVMRRRLPLNLRVLIPAVENAISGNAFRPGDILPTRKGITVEVGNTDAEGRLILCDALAFAAEEKPDAILDFATLTGAARVAMGPDLPPVFTHDDGLWDSLQSGSKKTEDPVWRLPLYSPYQSMLESSIADVCNISDAPFAGAIIAGLFLSRFVPEGQSWAHYDVFAWRTSAEPGRPTGAETHGLRATAEMLENWPK